MDHILYSSIDSLIVFNLGRLYVESWNWAAEPAVPPALPDLHGHHHVLRDLWVQTSRLDPLGCLGSASHSGSRPAELTSDSFPPSPQARGQQAGGAAGAPGGRWADVRADLRRPKPGHEGALLSCG